MLNVVLLALAMIASQSSTAPSVFIPPDEAVWWNSEKAQGRVIGVSAGVVTVSQISKFVEETTVYNSYSVCALTPVGNGTYVGLDKKTQDDIIRTIAYVRWRVDAVTPDGKKLIAQSVLYEACDDPDNRGAAVLVTNAAGTEVLMFQPMGVFTSTGKPIWTAFLLPPAKEDADAPLFSYSHCTECGAATSVYFDVTRQKLYTEYNGH